MEHHCLWVVHGGRKPASMTALDCLQTTSNIVVVSTGLCYGVSVVAECARRPVLVALECIEVPLRQLQFGVYARHRAGAVMYKRASRVPTRGNLLTPHNSRPCNSIFIASQGPPSEDSRHLEPASLQRIERVQGGVATSNKLSSGACSSLRNYSTQLIPRGTVSFVEG